MGQDAELLFRSLSQGDPGLIHCWSRVLLAEAPSRHRHLSVQGSREELLLPLDRCLLCPVGRVPGGPGAEHQGAVEKARRSLPSSVAHRGHSCCFSHSITVWICCVLTWSW